MFSTNIRRYAGLAALLAASAGCTVHSTEPPPLTGPSQLGLALRVSASPASIPQDGVSTSSITVLAIDENGRPKAGLPLRVDMLVDGQAVDFGTLSARSLTTGSSGTAFVTFTAPATPSNGIFGTCNGLAGSCLEIVAVPMNGENFMNINPASVQIRLTPPGNIIPTGDWTFSPVAPKANQDVTFDASGVLAEPGRILTGYRWDFNDGSQAKFGAVVAHDFGLAGSYNVTLTVTDDAGRTKVIGKRVTVS
jgi:PKD domain